jgi:hypothetical protein
MRSSLTSLSSEESSSWVARLAAAATTTSRYLLSKPPDEAELRSIFSDDPWTVSGVFRIKEVRPWTLWLDGRRGTPE